MPAILLHLLPATAYAVLAYLFWQQRQMAPATLGAPRGQRAAPAERLILLAALLLQGLGLKEDLFGADGMHFGFSTALALMVWLALLVYWVESLYSRLEGLQGLGLPLAALCTPLPLLFPAPHLTANAHTAAFRAHFVVAMLAYSLFTLAALHALLMAMAEKRLHQGRFSRIMANLPPLLTMEALLFRIILFAFLLLTATLVSGVFFSEALFGKPLEFSHKTLFAFLSWIIFAVLLIGRHLRGWRGKKALRLTLSGFTTLLLAYVGSRFVLEVILNRS